MAMVRRSACITLLLPLATQVTAVWQVETVEKRKVLDVTFESSKDYDITSAYAVRGWNTTEGKMRMIAPSAVAKHGGRFGLEVRIEKAYTKNFHAQFSLPHFMPRTSHSAYQLTYWAKQMGSGDMTPEVSILDVDEGYDWVGGAEIELGTEWQHIAMEPVYTNENQRGHELQIAFMIGATEGTVCFDDIQLYELDVPSPPPPAPPPPPSFLLWLDGESGPGGVQKIVREGVEGGMTADLSSMNAAYKGKYGYELIVTETFEQDFYAFMGLPAFLVTDHERVYRLSFWAKATGNPKPRPHITFQDEDNNYEYIYGDFVQLSAFWHQYHIDLVVPFKLRGHNVITNFMVGGFAGVYYLDDIQVVNAGFVAPPPASPAPPPSPPPNVLLQLDLENYEKGSITFQAWPEGEMQVIVQSPSAAHTGRNGLFVKVTRAFDADWRGQFSLKPFSPPDTNHGYTFSFWARASSEGTTTSTNMPKVVFADADDNYMPLKQVAVPMTSDWQMYQVDLAIPRYRHGHAVVITFWVGESMGSYSFDDLRVDIVPNFSPPPPSRHGLANSPPPPGVAALLGFEGTDDGVTSTHLVNNGSWTVSVPDPRSAHTGAHGLYVEVDKPWKVANLAQVLLPRYVPRAGKETLLHLSFWARVEKMHYVDPTPTVTVVLVDLHQNNKQLGGETIQLTSDWQMHYVVIDLKTEHVGHSIRPYLYLGRDAGIYSFDEFEYKEIEIEDGMEWLQRAPERIKRARMGKFKLTFQDEERWPIDYGKARASLVRHGFPLGVNLKTKSMAYAAGMTPADYEWYLKTAAKHFWTGTIEQHMQWYRYEPTPGDFEASQQSVEELLDWADEKGWPGMRAVLLDGGHSGKDHWSNQLACKDLESHMHKRLIRDVQHFKGRLTSYEVWKGALQWRDWIDRCGEALFHNAYRWTQQADANSILVTSEPGVLDSLTLTKAEAYHNMIWAMVSSGVPVGSVGVQASFDGEIDASTVKHRLDVLSEVQLPVYITSFSIMNVDPLKHAYELEKFLRIAFSHPAVAGITLGDFWDKSAERRGSGLYAEDKAPKPAVATLAKLFEEEWRTEVTHSLDSEGSLEVHGFYGSYAFELTFGDLSCRGQITLPQPAESTADWAEETVYELPPIMCTDFKAHMHVPLWITPALFAFVFVACLLGCFNKRRELVHSAPTVSTHGARPLRNQKRIDL